MRATGAFLALLLRLPVSAQPAAEKWVQEAEALRLKPSPANLELARDRLVQALSAVPDPTTLRARALYRMGQVQDSLEDHDAARASFEQAFELHTALGNRELAGFALHNLAAQLQVLGESTKALELYAQVLPVRREFKDKAGEAYTLYGMAAADWSLGESAAALDAYRGALAIWRELKSAGNEGHVRNSMGLIFVQLGDFARGRDEFHQALELWRRAGDNASPLLAWNNLCLAGVGERQYRRAIADCSTARKLAEEARNARAIAYSSHNLANAYAGLGQHDRAIELFEQSLERKREIKDRWGEAHTLQALGESRAAAGDRETALRLLEEALALSRSVGDQSAQVHTLGALARLRQTQGDLGQAQAAVDEALGLVESQRTKLASPDLRATYIASLRDLYEMRIDLLARAGRTEEALAASEHARGRLLLDRLGDTLAGIRNGVDPALVTRARSIARQLDAQTELLQRSASGPAGREAAVRRRIDSLLAEYRDASEQIRRASPRYSALTQPQPASAADLQALLEPGAVLLHFFLGKGRGFLWVVTRTSITWRELPSRSRVESEVRLLLDAIAHKKDTAAPASALSRTILQPAGPALTAARRVVIAADGELEPVPFAALPVAGRPLAALAEVSFLPSATALRLHRAGDPARGKPPRRIALFGDPVFSAEDPRAVATRSAAGEQTLPRLRFSRGEAEAIAALVPASLRTVSLDFDASRQTVDRTRLGDYQVIHFATHSVLDRRPELAGIALSKIDREGKPVDGFLRLHHVFDMNLRARLVTLSSCRSATGSPMAGEGLVSLARGFLYSGAAAVMGTLWDVDDRASAELMKRFYHGMFSRNLAPPAALRAAQNEVRSQPGWEHPYYWAGYVLHGEWR